MDGLRPILSADSSLLGTAVVDSSSRRAARGGLDGLGRGRRALRGGGNPIARLESKNAVEPRGGRPTPAERAEALRAADVLTAPLRLGMRDAQMRLCYDLRSTMKSTMSPTATCFRRARRRSSRRGGVCAEKACAELSIDCSEPACSSQRAGARRRGGERRRFRARRASGKGAGAGGASPRACSAPSSAARGGINEWPAQSDELLARWVVNRPRWDV